MGKRIRFRGRRPPWAFLAAGASVLVASCLRRTGRERRQAEAALQRTTHQLETSFASVHIMLAYLDRDFNFLRVNQAYAAVDGHEPSFSLHPVKDPAGQVERLVFLLIDVTDKVRARERLETHFKECAAPPICSYATAAKSSP